MMRSARALRSTSRIARGPRAWLAGVLTGLLLLAHGTLLSSPARAEDPAIAFMRRAANELINAQRKGGEGAFASVIERYGHVPAIGLSALGSYRAGLNPADRSNYYKGLVRFISRYAVKEGEKYGVARAEFPAAAINDGRSLLVDSRIVLTDGGTYDVRWMLIPQGGSFKIRDAQVVGFWVSPFLTKLFEDYIAENGGQVSALVVALNR